jgi:hypothetical protein
LPPQWVSFDYYISLVCVVTLKALHARVVSPYRKPLNSAAHRAFSGIE